MKYPTLISLLIAILALPGIAQGQSPAADAYQDRRIDASSTNAGCRKSPAPWQACYYTVASDGLLTVLVQVSSQRMNPPPFARQEMPLLINALHRGALGEAIPAEAATLLAQDSVSRRGGYVGRVDGVPVLVSPEVYEAFHRWWLSEERRKHPTPFPPALPLEDLWDERHPAHVRHGCTAPSHHRSPIDSGALFGCYESRASAGLLTYVFQAAPSSAIVDDLPLAGNFGLRLMRRLHQPQAAETTRP